MYRIRFSSQAQKDYWLWLSVGNAVIVKKIDALLEDLAAHPYTGIGKPEKLKYQLAGQWSRRINREHRIVYAVSESENEIYVFSLRHHYPKSS